MKNKSLFKDFHFRAYLIICLIVTLPGFLPAIFGQFCGESQIILFPYIVLGFPLSFIIGPFLEEIAKKLPSLYGSDCLGPIDLLLFSIPVWMNIGLIYLALIVIYKALKGDLPDGDR